MNPSAIHCERLTRRYGRRIGIDALDLDVPRGAIFGFLGPNGSGKTTTIRVLMGLLRPHGGRAAIFGRDCWRHSAAVKRGVGYLPGDLRLYRYMTGESALHSFGRIRGVDLQAEGAALAERFELDLHVRADRMSRGTRQKLGLVLALAHKPELLILDEPSNGLDPLVQRQLHALLRERAADGATVFFSSHTLSEVEQLCDRVAIVRQGRIVTDAGLGSLRRAAPRRVTVVFDDGEIAHRLAPPPGLSVEHRDGGRWQCQWTGDARPLLRWAAGHDVRDITIHPPDLETMFHHYYHAGGDGP
jgi:ABC-2 type transport system ATP-binding protein